MNAVLHMAPYTCARVTAIALLECGVAFEARPVRFMRGEHKAPAYRAINPLGKVPALEMDGHVLTENTAIITYLAERFPAAGLMPAASDAAGRARLLADLCFCAATLHPLVTRIRMPAFFAGEEHAATVKRIAAGAMAEYFAVIEQRLANGPWWYGEAWSALDAYLHWIFWRVEGAGFAAGPFPAFTDHARRNEQRDSVRQAMLLEDQMQRTMVEEGSAFQPVAV